jgi:succinyl-CoA synthetase beta subunit
VWASGTQGQAPADIRGAVVETPQGTRLRLVRNGGGSTLSGCDIVEYMSGDPTVFNVQKNSTADNGAVAGAVDYVYANKGKTVALGDLFWIIEHGPAYVISSTNTTTKGEIISPAAAARFTDAGASVQMGVALETQTATTIASTLAFLRL